MNVSGIGHIAAGEYDEKISISGSGKIDGNIRCVALYCSGAVTSTGYIVCNEDIKVSGSCNFKKGLTASSITTSGNLSVNEDINASETIVVSGTLSLGGSVKCALLKCSGSMDIGKGAEAEEIHISGKIKCAGLINAEKVDIKLDSFNTESTVGSIGGCDIKIHNERKGYKNSRMPLLSKLMGADRGFFTVNELVEGDSVAVEYVKAPRVVGRVVAIGEGCVIDNVQYSEEIEIHPDAKVGLCEKI